MEGLPVYKLRIFANHNMEGSNSNEPALAEKWGDMYPLRHLTVPLTSACKERQGRGLATAQEDKSRQHFSQLSDALGYQLTEFDSPVGMVHVIILTM